MFQNPHTLGCYDGSRLTVCAQAHTHIAKFNDLERQKDINTNKAFKQKLQDGDSTQRLRAHKPHEINRDVWELLVFGDSFWD